VTQQFKDVISRRQRALLSGNNQEYSKLRNPAKRMSLTLKKRNYDKKVRALYDADPHSRWKRTKQFLSTPDSDTLSHLSIDFGQTMTEAINDYFVGISQDFPPVDSKLLELLKSDRVNSEFIIEPWQLVIRLAKLNIYKAPGPDGLPTLILMDCAPFISEPLAAIFNSSLRQGHFRAIWKSAEVIPVPKTNPPCRIDSDLRPVSLLPVLAKVFEILSTIRY